MLRNSLRNGYLEVNKKNVVLQEKLNLKRREFRHSQELLQDTLCELNEARELLGELVVEVSEARHEINLLIAQKQERLELDLKAVKEAKIRLQIQIAQTRFLLRRQQD